MNILIFGTGITSAGFFFIYETLRVFPGKVLLLVLRVDESVSPSRCLVPAFTHLKNTKCIDNTETGVSLYTGFKQWHCVKSFNLRWPRPQPYDHDQKLSQDCLEARQCVENEYHCVTWLNWKHFLNALFTAKYNDLICDLLYTSFIRSNKATASWYKIESRNINEHK